MSEINEIQYVKATELNRGKASSYIKTAHDNNVDMVIIKNSEPYAVILSIENYHKLKENQERLERLNNLEKGLNQ